MTALFISISDSTQFKKYIFFLKIFPRQNYFSKNDKQ